MRSPSTNGSLYRWHSEALAYYRVHGSLRGFPGIHEDEPHPGFYKRRLFSRGPWIPASIRVVQQIDPETGELIGDERMTCEVVGEQRDVLEEWTYLAGHPISPEEYMTLLTLLFMPTGAD